MGEKIVTGIICMMSILFFLLALKIPPPHVDSTLGSAFWPKIILALLFVLSGWQLVILLRRPKEEERRLAQLAEAKRKQDEEETGERFVQKLFYFSIAYSWLYIFSIRYVGFTIATLAMMSIYLFMTGGEINDGFLF